MDASLLCPRPTMRFPTLGASTKQLRSLGSSSLRLKEIAVESPQIGLKKQTQFAVCCISPDGSKRGQSPRKRSASGRSRKEVKPKTSESSKQKVNSANQEEIISLFRRIQSSISKVESNSVKKRNSDENGDKPSADSVLEIIRNSRKQTKGKLSLEEGIKPMTQSESLPKKGEEEVAKVSPLANFKLTRPPSGFMKRSPIPAPTALRGKNLHSDNEATGHSNNEALPVLADSNGSQMLKIDEMKLTELKELAKSRGIKGYSKLKKKELMELLRT